MPPSGTAARFARDAAPGARAGQFPLRLRNDCDPDPLHRHDCQGVEPDRHRDRRLARTDRKIRLHVLVRRGLRRDLKMPVKRRSVKPWKAARSGEGAEHPVLVQKTGSKIRRTQLQRIALLLFPVQHRPLHRQPLPANPRSE